jgi:hypothetical protein
LIAFGNPNKCGTIISWNLREGTTLEINLVNMVPIHDNNGTP